ncbi:MAG: hypothetical protein NDJ89_12125 [Oligoflexia bacterium]|nr:hypothetical protein [Oligoflexia bacterium]
MILSFLLSLLALGSALASPPCSENRPSLPPQQQLKSIFESACEVKFHADSCTEYWGQQLAHMKEADEQREWVKKLGSCHRGDRTFLEQTGVSSLSCLNGLKDSVIGLPKAIYGFVKAGFECNKDVEGKRQKLDLFNSYLEPSERLALDEYALKTLPCPEFEQRLRTHTREIRNRRMEEYHRTGDRKVFEKFRARDEQDRALAKRLFDELKIKLDCYAPEAQTELYCEMVGVIALVAIPVGGGVQAASKISSTGRLARLTGRTPEELEKLVREFRAMSKEDRIRLARNRNYDKLELKDRVAETERLLGRPLSESQAKALEKAHNIGDGYGLYTKKELFAKGRELELGGFKVSEERQLILLAGLAGRTGTKTAVEAAEGATQQLQMQALQVSSTAGVSNGVANGSAAQTTWLKAAQSAEKELKVIVPDKEIHEAVRKSSDFILDPNKAYARAADRDAFNSFDGLIGRTQYDYEQVAVSYLRAGRTEEARRVLEQSPVVRHLPGDGPSHYVQRIIRENQVSY